MSGFGAGSLEALQVDWPAVRVGATFRSVREGGKEFSLAGGEELQIASVGKLLLLIEVARQIASGHLDPAELLSRKSVEPIADSGIWQHLGINSLPVADLGALVAAASDNLATNVLLERIGLKAVDATRVALGLQRTRLLDRVRDTRGHGQSETLALGSADELCDLMEALGDGSAISEDVSRVVLGWMTANVDQSMVGAGFGVDPLAHASPGNELRVHNKTGSDLGLRAEVGSLSGPAGRVSYAVIVNWPADIEAPAQRIATALREVGEALRDIVTP